MQHTKPTSVVFDVRFLTATSSEYVAWGRARAVRSRDERPVWAGARRDPGEAIGKDVEKCVVRILERVVGPSGPNILSWRALQGARATTLYRELDYVTRPDEDTVVLWEIKFTHEGNVARGHGLKQLEASSGLVREGDEAGKRVVRRLVYVVSEPLEVCEGAIPHVSIENLGPEVGAVFVHPLDVERAAIEAGVRLPQGWSEPRTPSEPAAEVPFAEPTITAFGHALRTFVL